MQRPPSVWLYTGGRRLFVHAGGLFEIERLSGIERLSEMRRNILSPAAPEIGQPGRLENSRPRNRWHIKPPRTMAARYRRFPAAVPMVRAIWWKTICPFG